MKIHVLPDSTQTQAEQAAWLEHVTQATERYHTGCEPPRHPFETARYLAEGRALDVSPYITAMWQEHHDRAEELLLSGDPKLFQDGLIQYAMFLSIGGQWQADQLRFLEAHWDPEALHGLLKEGHVLHPSISCEAYETSESAINHLSHITFFEQQAQVRLADQETLVEFGGGYGGFCRLCRRINPGTTHVIIDLPVMLFLQSFVLQNSFEEDCVRILLKAEDRIEPGKINLVPMGSPLLDGLADLNPDLFIATWSLSEANACSQAFVRDRDYFKARHLLMGYRHYGGEINPRQPCSDSIQLTEAYATLYRDRTPFSDLHHYLVARRTVD